jgi:hypothetical protein
LRNATFFQHQDAVEVAHGRQSVGDGNYGAPAYKTRERLTDLLLGVTIKSRCRFIEQ